MFGRTSYVRVSNAYIHTKYGLMKICESVDNSNYYINITT